MSVSVYLSVCLLEYLKNRMSKLHKIFYTSYPAMARSCSDDNGLCYVLPVLWMTSNFPIMGLMACGVGSIYVSAVLKQVAKS